MCDSDHKEDRNCMIEKAFGLESLLEPPPAIARGKQ